MTENPYLVEGKIYMQLFLAAKDDYKKDKTVDTFATMATYRALMHIMAGCAKTYHQGDNHVG